MKHQRTKGAALLAALLFVALTAFPAAAERGPVSAVTSYYLTDTLYAFARFPGAEDDADAPKAGLMVHGVQIGEEAEAHRLARAAEPAEYMLLVDCSGSMPAYRRQIQALADALLDAGRDVTVTVAAFGDSFRVVAEDLTDAAAVRRALSGLYYNDQGTDICGGVVHAVDYMRTNATEPGALSSVVLITDGEPFYTNNAAKEAESEAAAAEALRELIGKTPQAHRDRIGRHGGHSHPGVIRPASAFALFHQDNQ